MKAKQSLFTFLQKKGQKIKNKKDRKAYLWKTTRLLQDKKTYGLKAEKTDTEENEERIVLALKKLQ